MKRITFFLSLFFTMIVLGAGQISFTDFQKISSSSEGQTLFESSKFKAIVQSYKPGVPTTQDEFDKFTRSIAFWKIKRAPEFQQLIEKLKSSSSPQVDSTGAVVEGPPKVKTERELYLEKFMAKAPVVTPTVEPQPTVIEDLTGEEDLEKQLEDIQKNSNELLKIAQPENGELDMEAATKLLNKNMAGKVADGKSVSIVDNPHIVVGKMLAPFQAMEEAAIVEQLMAQTKTHKAAQFAYKYVPKLPTFIARLMKSKEAIPKIATITIDKKRLTIYFVLNLVTIILGFIMKRVTATQIEFGKQVKNFFFRVFILYAVRIGLFVYFFGTEFKPAADIFMNTFF